jgi:hypothetical protein
MVKAIPTPGPPTTESSAAPPGSNIERKAETETEGEAKAERRENLNYNDDEVTAAAIAIASPITTRANPLLEDHGLERFNTDRQAKIDAATSLRPDPPTTALSDGPPGDGAEREADAELGENINNNEDAVTASVTAISIAAMANSLLQDHGRARSIRERHSKMNVDTVRRPDPPTTDLPEGPPGIDIETEVEAQAELGENLNNNKDEVTAAAATGTSIAAWANPLLQDHGLERSNKERQAKIKAATGRRPVSNTIPDQSINSSTSTTTSSSVTTTRGLRKNLPLKPSKRPDVGDPADSTVGVAAVIPLNDSQVQQQTQSIVSPTIGAMGPTQNDSLHFSMAVGTDTMDIGTRAPTAEIGTGDSGAIQVTARLVEEESEAIDQVFIATALAVPQNSVQQVLPDTHTPGGRWLCFGIVLVLGGVVTVGILCGSGVCSSPSNQNAPTSPPIPTNAPLPTTAPNTNYCGLTWSDAAITCGPICPGGVDSECPSGESCFGGITSCHNAPTKTSTVNPTKAPIGDTPANYCGLTWSDAAITCGQKCPGGFDIECPSGARCFAEIASCQGTQTKTPTVTPPKAPTVGAPTNYCGLTWRDAAITCGQTCPGGVDSECPSGARCFGDITSCSSTSTETPTFTPTKVPAGGTPTNYCGLTWSDAGSTCGQTCPGGVDSECPSGAHCFAGISSCQSTPTEAPANTPTEAQTG